WQWRWFGRGSGPRTPGVVFSAGRVNCTVGPAARAASGARTRVKTAAERSMCRSSCGSGSDGTGPRHAARRKREPPLLAGRAADAVARVAAVVATRVTVGAVAVARAGDPGLAGRRRWVALGGIARDERYGEPVGAIGLELGDAAEAGDEAGEVADRAAAGRPAR